MAGNAVMTAVAMVKALEDQGYETEMAKIALEQVAYKDLHTAAVLLNEWSGGAPAAVAAAPPGGVDGVGEPEEHGVGDDGYDGDGDEDDDGDGADRQPRPATPRSSPVDDVPLPPDDVASSTPTAGEPRDPNTPPSTPPRIAPPHVRSSRGSRPTPSIDLPGKGVGGTSTRSAGEAQRQRYAEAALGLAEWDVGTIGQKLQMFRQEIEAGVPVSTISLCLDPATSLGPEPEPEPQVGSGVQETDPLEDFRIWLKQVNLLRQEAQLLEQLDINAPLKDLATHDATEIDKLVGLLGLTEPMERLFKRNLELLRENGGRVAAPVTKGDPSRISMIFENAWAELSDQEKAAASTVGYSEEMWASFGSLGGSTVWRPTTKCWGDLSPNEKAAANVLGFGEIEWDEMRPISGATLVRQNATSIDALALERGSADSQKRDSGSLSTIPETPPFDDNATASSLGCVKKPIEPKLEIIKALMDMGFTENAARRAAIKVNNIGIENAVEWCFAHTEDPDFNDPIEIAIPPPLLMSQNAGQAFSSTDEEPANPQHGATAPVAVGADGLPHVPEADVDSVDVDDADFEDPELAAELAALEGDDGGGGAAVVGPSPVPAPPRAVAPAPAPVVDTAKIAYIEQQILLRRKAGIAAKKKNDTQSMQKCLREIKILQGQKQQLEAGADAAPAPAPAQSSSVLGPVPRYSPPNLPHNVYAAPDSGILDGSKAHEHVRPDLGEADQQSRSKRRTETGVTNGFEASLTTGDAATTVTEINPAYVPGTTAGTSPPQDDWSTEVAQLLEMGFEESAIRKALASSAGDVSTATQRLLSGSSDMDGDGTKKRVGFSDNCVAQTDCELGCKTVTEHLAAKGGVPQDEVVLVESTNRSANRAQQPAGALDLVLVDSTNTSSSTGAPQPQPPALPKPNQSRPRRSAGRPYLTRPQKEQIEKCIQVLAQKTPGKQRPAWHQKVEQFLAMDDGEDLIAEYQRTYSHMISEMTEVMISLLRVANEDPVGQSEADEPPAVGEMAANTIVIDGSDDPTLQQFIDRVNDALKERDDAIAASPEPETFHDLCVQLGIEDCENCLAMNSVDSKEQLQMLASHGLKKSDCEEIGLSEQQRDSILQWASRPVIGLKVYVVAVQRAALWHPIIGNTASNLPRDLRQLVHANAEGGIADATEVKVDVQYEDANKQAADGPEVTLHLGSSSSMVFKHATTRWVCIWLEKLLDPDAFVYDKDSGNPALRTLALDKMVHCGGIQEVVSAVTTPGAFPGWHTLFTALNLLHTIEDPPQAEHIGHVVAVVEQNYRVDVPSTTNGWRYFLLCMSMLHHAAGPHFDVASKLAYVVEEMPAQSPDTCAGIYRHALKRSLAEHLLRLIRDALSRATPLVTFHRQASAEDHALQRECSAQKLSKQRSKLDEKDATLALLVSEGIDPGTLASEVEEIKDQIDDSEAEISRADKAAEAADTLEALLMRVNHIVDKIPSAGAAIGQDEEWFLCLLDVVRLSPPPEHGETDIREMAWRLLKHSSVPVPHAIEEQLQRFEIDWEGDLFLTVYQLHAVQQLLTAAANPAWKRGFIREHSHVAHFVNFVRSLDFSDSFMCNTALSDVFGIFQYCVEQLIAFTAEELANGMPAPSPASPELQQLVNMGFAEDQSAAMLLKCHNRVDVAATHLMDATEPDSSDFSSDEDPEAAELQRCVSVSSASVLHQNLLGNDDGATLVQQLCSMMRKAYDCHIATKSNHMACTLLAGMDIIITMLQGNIGAMCSEPESGQIVAVLEAGVCSLLANGEEREHRSSASERLFQLCDISSDTTATVYSVLRRAEFKPPPADSAQYFKVLLHMLQKQPTVRPTLVGDMLAFVHDWETSLDDRATVNHIKLLARAMKLDAALIPEHCAVQLMDVLCDRYLISASDPPIFREDLSRRHTCRLLIEIVDTHKDKQANLLQRMSNFITETPPPPWNYTSAEDRFDQLVRHASGLAGLTNKGNTCYMNSSLQQLYALPELREAITHDSLLPAVHEGNEGIRVRVKNKAKCLAEHKISVHLISVHPEESQGVNKVHLCEGLGYVAGRQEAEVTLASTCKTNTSSYSDVIPPGKYNVVVTDSDDASALPFVDIVVDLVPSGTRKANYTLELSGEAVVHCNATAKLLPRALQRCMFQLEHSKTAVFDTREVCNACEELQEFSTLTLEGGVHRQHDAAEFVGVLLEYLEDEMPGTNLLARLKGFFTRTVVTLWFPKDAGYEDTVVPGEREESFGPFGPVDISAKSTGGTLQECMQDSVSHSSSMNEDVFTGLEVAEGWSTATRTQVIKVLPRVLMMSLGRFKYNMTTGRTDKLNYRIEFPQDLDMSPYTEEYIMAARNGRNLPPPCWFELVGVITHQGTASAGHYFSYAKHNSKWLKLNDERVAEVSIEALEKECFGDGRSNTNAYMLVYRAKDIGGDDVLEPAEDVEATGTAAMKAKLAALADTDPSDVVAVTSGAKAGGPVEMECVGLTRTSTLSNEVDMENEALLRQAELFDEDVLNLILKVCWMHLRTGTMNWTREIPDDERQLVWNVGLNVLSRVLVRWKNMAKVCELFSVQDWVNLLRAAVRPDPWPMQVDTDEEDQTEDADAAIEPAAMVAEATETAWRLLAPWLIQQWDNRQCAEDWSGLLGPHVEGPLRLSMCTLLRATQTALRGTADAPLFDALPLAHGGTIGSVLEDLVVAEGVCGSVAYANTKRLDLAIETIVERGSRVNARSVQEALRTVPMVQVELHKQRIGIRVWNLLQVESLRVYSVETRATPRAQWKPLGDGAISPVRWSAGGPYSKSGTLDAHCTEGTLLMVSVNGDTVAEYAVTGADRQHIFVQRGEGADPTLSQPEPDPELQASDNDANAAAAHNSPVCSYGGNTTPERMYGFAVGDKVEVLWENDNRFYAGTVTEIVDFDPEDQGLKVTYDPTDEYPDHNDEFIKAKEFNFRLRKPRESSTTELAVKYANELEMLKALGLPEDKTEADMLEMLDVATGDVQNAYQLLSTGDL